METFPMVVPGQKIGRYEIVGELGRGAMGAVFEARDPKIGRTVAIKTIAMPGSDAEELEQSQQRFFREAQAAGKLSAPGIVTIHDVGVDKSSRTPFIVMEYVAGKTLDRFVQESTGSRLSTEKALDLLHQLAEALDYAHQQNIVHRDIKPANILITAQGRAKIADFGIAKLTHSELTVSGKIMGTPAYMSPEQINGGKVDGRSDLFSLGVIAYWLLTGEKPFTGDSVTSISLKVALKDPVAPRELNPSISPELEEMLSRALAKNPDERYQCGRDFAEDIENIQAGRPLGPLKPPAAQQAMPDATVPEATIALAAPAPPSRLRTATRAVGRFTARAAIACGVFLLRTIAFLLRPIGRLFARIGQAIARRLPRWMLRIPRRWVLITTLALLSLCAAFLIKRWITPEATLEVVCQHQFRSAELSIWIDDRPEYHGKLKGTSHKHVVSRSKTTYTIEGVVALTLPVRPGEHTVRVNVRVPGETFDLTKSIQGQFTANGERKLRLDLTESDLTLAWE